MARTRFGELEEQILLTLLRLGGESYAVPVIQELQRTTGRDVSPATAFMVMRRLADRGCLESRLGDPTPVRGGRPKRLFRIVPEAVLPGLRESRRSMLALWDGLGPTLDGP